MSMALTQVRFACALVYPPTQDRSNSSFASKVCITGRKILVPGSDCASYVRATRAQSPWKNGRKIELKFPKKEIFHFNAEIKRSSRFGFLSF